MKQPFWIVPSLVMALGSSGFAQDQTVPRFEVASIRLNRLARGAWNVPLAGGKINYTGDSLKDLIAFAWGINSDRVVGGPSWIASNRYDLAAKAEDGATNGMSTTQVMHYVALMMRSLLIERFHVAVHFETKESLLYELVVARKDGRLGPALKEPKVGGCEEPDLSKPFVMPENGKFPELACGMGFILFQGRLRGADVELKQLAEFLSKSVGRTVVDKTGLKQRFDVDMERIASHRRADTDGPSIFSALEEQLGLKLESRRGPVEFLIVGHAEEPTEN